MFVAPDRHVTPSEHVVPFAVRVLNSHCDPQATTFGTVLALNPGINVYDITKQCEGALCYDFTLADQYLNSKAVRAQLHVNRTWEGCSMDVNADFFSEL